jgi:hypothetical protein
MVSHGSCFPGARGVRLESEGVGVHRAADTITNDAGTDHFSGLPTFRQLYAGLANGESRGQSRALEQSRALDTAPRLQSVRNREADQPFSGVPPAVLANLGHERVKPGCWVLLKVPPAAL